MEDLSAKQIQAISLLALGYTAKEVAQKLKCTPETISHWRRKTNFQNELNQIKLELVKSTVTKLQATSSIAVDCLADLIKNSKSDEVRRKSSVDVLQIIGIKNENSNPSYWILPESAKEALEKADEKTLNKGMNDLLKTYADLLDIYN